MKMFCGGHMTATRIRLCKIGLRGKRGMVVSLPSIQAQDLGVSPGDSLSMYKGVLAGKPVIILANTDAPYLMDEASVQGAELRAFMDSARAASPANA